MDNGQLENDIWFLFLTIENGINQTVDKTIATILKLNKSIITK